MLENSTTSSKAAGGYTHPVSDGSQLHRRAAGVRVRKE